MKWRDDRIDAHIHRTHTHESEIAHQKPTHKCTYKFCSLFGQRLRINRSIELILVVAFMTSVEFAFYIVVEIRFL